MGCGDDSKSRQLSDSGNSCRLKGNQTPTASRPLIPITKEKIVDEEEREKDK